jgi:hypothetical protein
VEKYGRARQATDDNIIRYMCFACCITKARIHTLKMTLTAVPLQQWLHECASVLQFYVHCMSCGDTRLLLQRALVFGLCCLVYVLLQNSLW